MQLSMKQGGAVVLLESTFLDKAQAFKPACVEGVCEKFRFPVPPPKPDEAAELHEAFKRKKQEYQDRIHAEFSLFVQDESSSIYLGLQPMWSVSTQTLVGVEVLCRIANGKDDAPMPGLSIFQVTQKDKALKFLEKQCDFAVEACKKLRSITVSVNVRPDELVASQGMLLKKVGETLVDGVSNLIFEITEYAPITDEVIATIRRMKDAGAVFALDDITEVVEKPGKAMAELGKHSCSFSLAKQYAELFAVQKLALPMSCSVFRAEVFPTPAYDGGKAQPYLKSMIFPEDQIDEIQQRTKLVEDWYSEVSKQNPATRFVIECTIDKEGLFDDESKTPKHPFPRVPLLNGMFASQGGKSGGRVFPLEAFLPA